VHFYHSIMAKSLNVETYQCHSTIISSGSSGSAKTLHVFADHHINAGTKDRVSAKYISHCISNVMKRDIKCLLYTSSYNGFGPVACASGARSNGLDCTLVLCLKGFGHSKESTIDEANASLSVIRAREYGAKIFFAKTWQEMIHLGKKISEEENVWWLPLGFKDDLYVQMLADELIEAVKATTFPSPVNRIFVVGGCGVIARVLSIVFPNTTIMLVPIIFGGQSYFKLKSYVSQSKNIQLINKHSPQVVSPYPSVINYDSRAWDSAVDIGISGDYVWNVAE